MLVLTRQREQAIVIDGPCTIRVLEIRDGSVRLGIDADKEVRILREELTPLPMDRNAV